MLVVAPRPQLTESLMGYVLRLTELNGYPTTAYVLASLDGDRFRRNASRLDAGGLISLAGLSQGEVDRLTHMPTDRSRAYIRLYGTDLPGFEVNMRYPRVCPTCLAEGRPCEAFWDMAKASVCPVHRVHLVTQCPRCSKSLLWSRSTVWKCKCGFDLRTAAVVPVNPALADLMAVMRHKVYRDEAVAPLPTMMTHLAHLDLRRFCKLIWVLCSLLHQEHANQRSSKARCHYEAQMEIVASALVNWPLGFRALLADLYDKEIEESEELPPFATTFSWLLVRLIKNDEADGSAFEFIEREVYQFGSKYWTRSAIARDGKAKSLMPEKMRWGTLCEASEATGLHKLTIKKRIASGEIKTRRIKKNSSRAIVVDMDSIREQNISQYPAVCIRDAARMIGVSIKTLRELRVSGVFEENYRSNFLGSLAKEDVEVFAAVFKSLCSNRKAINTPDSTTLDNAFIEFTASPKEKSELFARLIADPALIVGKKRGGGAGRLQVLRSTITDHFRSVRSGSEACITLLKTAKLLGCATNVVTSLKRGGYIKTSKQYGQLTPTLASVIEFDTTYVGMKKISKRVGLGVKTAHARFDFGKFDHIKLKFSKHTTIFVLRKDLPQIEKLLVASKLKQC